MKCSYCEKEAKSKCNCIEPYMCEDHLGRHLIEKQNHSYEKFEIDIGDSELLNLRSKIIENINLVNTEKNNLELKTKWLFEQIGEMHRNSVELMDSLIKGYLEILHHSKFCTSEMPKIEEVKNTEIIAKNCDYHNIRHVIERLYPSELRNQNQKLLIMSEMAYEEYLERSNNYLGKIDGMNLRTKINYLLPILTNYWNEEDCYDKIKQILVNNDGKYFFVCK